MNTNDEEAGIASARRAIEDDIEDRQFAFGGAVQYLLRMAARRGTVAEESAYLEQHAPGILDIDATDIPNKYRNAQFVAFDAWYTTLSQDELARRAEKLHGIAAAFGVDPLANPQTQITALAMEGEIEQAIEVALEKWFSESVAQHLGWRDDLSQAHFAEFVKDPRIVAAMQKWENEEETIRDRVRSFLMDLSTA